MSLIYKKVNNLQLKDNMTMLLLCPNIKGVHPILFNAWVNIPFVNDLSHGPILALEDVNISFFISFFLYRLSSISI